MSTMAELEQLAGAYAAQRDDLQSLSDHCRDLRRQAVRGKLAELKTLVAATSTARDALMQALGDSPELFEKPKSRSFLGIKIGYRKKKGQVVIGDEEKTLKLIRETLPTDQATMLIRVRESVDKNAVGDLVVSDLKRLGITIEDDTDQPFVTEAKSDLDELVDALLGDVADA